MALFKAKARQTSAVSRVSEGADSYVRALRDGSLSTAGFIQAMCMEGRMFAANGGTATGPLTFGAGSLDTTEIDMLVLAPAGTTIIPIEVCIQVEAYGSTAIFEALVSCGSGGVVGTDTDVVPVCMNTHLGYTAQCACGVSSAADATYFTSNLIELERWGAAKAVTVGTADDDSAWPPANYAWRASQGGYLPIIKGIGGLAVFVAAQASTGFISAKWIEVPDSYFS